MNDSHFQYYGKQKEDHERSMNYHHREMKRLENTMLALSWTIVFWIPAAVAGVDHEKKRNKHISLYNYYCRKGIDERKNAIKIERYIRFYSIILNSTENRILELNKQKNPLIEKRDKMVKESSKLQDITLAAEYAILHLKNPDKSLLVKAKIAVLQEIGSSF